jgi:L-2-hydroxyglutarate oxidase LhgO
MYLMCRNNVRYSKVGKWIVSTNQFEDARLEEIRTTAALSNVRLHYLTKEEILQEPSLKVLSFLLSFLLLRLQVASVLCAPNTGIVDSHSLMGHLEYQFTQNGGIIALGYVIYYLLFFSAYS